MFLGGRLRDFLRQSDWWLFVSPALIIGLSLTVLYSISAVRTGGDLFLFKKQLVVALAGLILALIISAINYRTWQSVSWVIYLATLLLLVAVLIFGQKIHATRGWFNIGQWQFQPVEFTKLTLVIILASYFARRSRELNLFSNLIQSFVLAALPVALVLLQPDFGSAAILFSLWFSMLLIIGVRRRYVVALFVLMIGGLLISWLFLFAPYQKARLVSFFFPSERTRTQSYNVRQAIIAIGSGEITGRGLGSGTQSQLKFLPEAGTDFIFAVVGEELGFVGVAVLFGLFGIWYYRVFRLLLKCRDEFASFILVGTAVLIFIEIFISAGMAMGVVPVVGVPFPFVSAGGSSLLTHLILVGIVAGIARQENASGYRISGLSIV